MVASTFLILIILIIRRREGGTNFGQDPDASPSATGPVLVRVFLEVGLVLVFLGEGPSIEGTKSGFGRSSAEPWV